MATGSHNGLLKGAVGQNLGLLTGNDSKTAASPASLVTAHKFGNLEHTAQPVGRKVTFPGASGGRNLFQAAPLVLALFRQLVWSESTL